MSRPGMDSKYPPTEFSQKYAAVLAPKGKLISPEDVFGEGKAFDADVEEKTRQAFKVTIKKLEKINVATVKHKEDLAREKIDQVRIKYILVFSNLIQLSVFTTAKTRNR